MGGGGGCSKTGGEGSSKKGVQLKKRGGNGGGERLEVEEPLERGKMGGGGGQWYNTEFTKAKPEGTTLMAQHPLRVRVGGRNKWLPASTTFPGGGGGVRGRSGC